ncbi:F-box/LRR-repeat/kelch-repeat protein At1g09650-like [Setaria italica]|uniref:F-box/LRR-repeat/kelch-repeat protein At1g09650-like n=1 Tax=Setaria italica TaxID=4555 RepID=UPI000BE57E56|nr:F-box/LRR-repeat/kelch-repeat protein At1g09650-like [Setaria italica]
MPADQSDQQAGAADDDGAPGEAPPPDDGRHHPGRPTDVRGPGPPPSQKSVGRCRCVCRSWRAGIASAAFVRRHLELSRASPPSVLAIPRKTDRFDERATSSEISFHRLPLPPPGQAQGILHWELLLEKAWPEGITCLILPAHCDGLVAIATVTDRVFVCNPATREFLALPLGSHNAEVALGFDRWRNRYVVARYFYRTYGEPFVDEVNGEYHAAPDHDVGHEVFTLGGDSWELTQDPPHPVGVHQPICTRRAFYWHADEPQPRLMRFSLQHRAFDVVRRPPTGWNPGVDDMAGLDDGKRLCYVHAAAEASFQVWMADDDGGPELQWSLQWRINLRDPVPYLNYSLMPVIADGDTLVAVAGGTMWRCDMQDEGVEEVVVELHNVRYGRLDGSVYYVV